MYLTSKCGTGSRKWRTWPFGTRRTIASLVCLLTLSLSDGAVDAGAVERLTVTDERTLRVPASREQLTVLTFPASVLQAVTSVSSVELKTNDRHVVVSPLDRPTDLVVTTTQYVYVLSLQPDDRPADTVVIDDVRLGEASGYGSHAPAARHTHQDLVLDLLQAAAAGRWPKGATPQLLPASAAPVWTDLVSEQILRATVRAAGGTYELRRYVFRNAASRPRSFREQEFYTGREFGIALSRQVVEPGDRMVVSVVAIADEPAPPSDDPAERLDPGRDAQTKKGVSQ